MQVTQLAAQGLKREYKVIVAANEINGKVDAKLSELQKTAKMPGFRPGKVPQKILRQQYGRSVMGEVLEQAVKEGSQKAVVDHAIRPALEPKIEVTSFEEGKDLELKIDVEILPDVPEIDLKSINVTRLKADVPPEDIEQSMKQLISSQRQFAKIEEERASQEGDQILIDFTGTVDGEAFEGGSAQDFQLNLGDKTMIPGFEEQLVGKSAGDSTEIDVTFPENYANTDLAGKPAKFAVTIKEIRTADEVVLDEEFAKKFGFDSMDAITEEIKKGKQQQLDDISRQKIKRELLDQLEDGYKFDVPGGMVDLEFEGIWKQLEEQMKKDNQSFDDIDQSEEEARKEYQGIAERRVRLGLILSDLGTKNDLKVEPQELQQAIIEQSRRFPGQEKEVFEYFQKNRGALEQLRAPIFEDKVIDFILNLATVTEKEVSVEQLTRESEEETPDNEVQGKGEPAT